MTTNIVFLLGVYPSYGGVEKVTTVLANEFHKIGCSVTIVSFEQPYPELASELAEGINVEKLDYPVASRRNVNKLRGIIENSKAEVLINQWCVPFYVTWLCSKATKGTGCKVVAVHHNLPNTNKRIKEIEEDIAAHRGVAIINKMKLSAVKMVSRLSLYYALKKSERFVLLSPSFIPLTCEFLFNTSSTKIIGIANPLTISPSEEHCDKQNEIVYVGRIEEKQKRTQRLVNVWSLLEDKHPNWKLTIVGDGPDKEELAKQIEKASTKRISLEGFQNPIDYYKRAKIILLVSDFEGFGLVLVEGMEYGCVPVVHDSYLASHDIVDHGVNGLLVPTPFDSELFAKEVEKLIDDEPLYNTMSQNAMHKARAFSAEETAKRWMSLFVEINGEKHNNASK